MRILELNFEKGWRGGERQTLYCLQGLSEAGVSVALACRAGTPMEAEARKLDVEVFAFPHIFQLIVFLITRGKRFDCLHAQTSSVLTYCVFTKWIHGCKTVYSRRVNFMPKGYLTWLKYRYTDKLLAISEAIQETLIQFTHRTDIEIVSSISVQEIIHPEIAATRMNALPLKGKKCIASMAAFTYEKDPFCLIEAIHILKQKRADFIFLHFGEGRLKPEVEAKIASYGLEETYILMGFVDEPQAYYPYFDVFVMSSLQEGLGSSVLDAFMYEVPVVSTLAGGLKNLISGQRGIAVNPGDPVALATALNEMLQYEKAHNPYIPAAKAYVEKQHDMKQITQKLIDQFDRLCNH